MTLALRVTADDYGISPGVSASIRELLDAGRLSGTSAMTTFDTWAVEGPLLARYRAFTTLGVHLTLTDHTPIGAMPVLAPAGRFPSFPNLARAAFLGGLDAEEVHAELLRQVRRFTQVIGRVPDFLDGHHHVQQLPVVRDAVLRIAKEELGPHAWVRTCVERVGTVWRRGVAVPRALLFATAGMPLDRALRRAQIHTNNGFTGLYDFAPDAPYADLFARFLDGVRDGASLLVHPGVVDDVLRGRDGLTTAREVELRFLAGPEFPALLARAGAHVATAADLHRLAS